MHLNDKGGVSAAPDIACQLFPVFAPGVGGEGFPEVAGDQAPGQVVQRRGQHIRSGRKLQRPLTAQPHGPGIRLQALQRQHGTLTGPQGQFHPQGRRLPGR